MTITFSNPQREPDMKPRITVIGVGGAGGNAVNNMISANIEGVEFVVANTDAQSIAQSLSERRIQLGKTITQGLGAGARPDVGRAAAEEALNEIIENLQGSNMVFVAAGMGGGTGTGAAPVIAAAAREQGILTVGVVTKPFQFEGNHRMRTAEAGILELEKYVDTLIIIPNQNLFRVANEKTTFADAFKMADDVLCTGVRGVTDLMVMPGLINLDFADIRTVMSEMGKAMMGTGQAEGESRARMAAEAAISNPLLEDASMKGARGVLINITGGLDMTLMEVDEAANRIRDEVDPDANIIFGSTFDQAMQGTMRVSVVATGIAASAANQPKTTILSLGGNAVAGQPARAAIGNNRQSPATMATGMSPMPVQPLAATAMAATPAPQPVAPPPIAAMMEEPEYEEEEDQIVVEERPMAAAVKPTEPASRASAQDLLASDWRTMGGQAGGGNTRPAAEPMRAQPQPQSMPMTPPPAPMHAPQMSAPQMSAPQMSQPHMASPMAPRMTPRQPEARAPEMGRAGMDAYTTTATAYALQPNYAPQAAPQPMVAQPVAQPAKSPSLFQRMTGAARREAAPHAETAMPAAPQAVPQAPQAFQPAPPAPAPQAPVQEARPEPKMRPTQPKLGGLDPTERLQTARAEEDMLDIPAFLRRQAN